MEEWREYKIGDVCRIKHGFAFKGIYFVDDQQKYVCVTPGNFALKGGFKNDKPKYYNGPIPEDYVLQKDDLVVTMTDLSKNGDTLGYSALIPYDEHYTFLHNQRIGLIEDISNEIDKHFLYWVMRTYDYQRYIVGHCSGSTVKHTSPSGIGSYIFRCPDMETQREISSILDNLDDKIEVNRKINENLEQQAQALFKSWFVDFEPFKNGAFVESELGMIPKGWRVGRYDEIIESTISGDWGKESPEGNYTHKVACIRGCDFQDIKNGLRGKTPERYILEKNFQTKHFKDKDVLVEISGGTATVSTGRVCPVSQLLIDKFNEDIVCTNFCRLVRPKPSYGAYLYYSWLYKFNNKVMFGYENGTSGIKNFRIKDFTSLEPIVIPSESSLQLFQSMIDKLQMKLQMNGSESQKLASLRDTLLPKLMSGELKVNEIEK